MSVGELAAWAALAIALLACIVLVLQARRLARVERRLRALSAGAGPGTDSMSITDLLAAQGTRLDDTRTQLTDLRGSVVSLDTGVAKSVQHVGLIRFNPFQDTGGDQSFALALLDRHGDGVVVSSLHTRTATRFYAKPVKGGTSALSLSDEEVQAVKQAMEGTSQARTP